MVTLELYVEAIVADSKEDVEAVAVRALNDSSSPEYDVVVVRIVRPTTSNPMNNSIIADAKAPNTDSGEAELGTNIGTYIIFYNSQFD